MQIDLRTVTIEPLRHTYDHLAARFGNKPASRYQEGSYDIQAVENLHYAPTWDPQQSLYDTRITRIVMQDWYALKDPRQFYYSSYTLTRARQQETAEANFNFVESRGLAAMLPDALRDTALRLLLPLRHAAWGANQNNTLICGYGYGAVFTQPCMYQAMDQLGIAQYLSRLGLLLGDVDTLAEAKRAWLEDATWQPLRRLVEDTMVVRDPCELFVAQNLAIDGLLYPLVYERLVDGLLSAQGGSAVAMLTQFMSDWFDETRKWVDAVLKTMAAESEANRQQLRDWTLHWSARAAEAITPVVAIALGEQAAEIVDEQLGQFRSRVARTGIAL
jgi:phenol hydroxylase P1 protein